MASSVHRALVLPTMLFALAGCGLQACGPSDPDRETDTACDDRASPDGGKATVELGDSSLGGLRVSVTFARALRSGIE